MIRSDETMLKHHVHELCLLNVIFLSFYILMHKVRWIKITWCERDLALLKVITILISGIWIVSFNLYLKYRNQEHPIIFWNL